jgi:TonB family protein
VCSLVRSGLCFVVLASSDVLARDQTPAVVRDWLSGVITKIARVDGEAANSAQRRASGTVTIRVDIAADGFVNRVTIEQSSGSPELDERARSLVRAASPFGPPPPQLLTKAGTTELSFPFRLGR